MKMFNKLKNEVDKKEAEMRKKDGKKKENVHTKNWEDIKTSVDTANSDKPIWIEGATEGLPKQARPIESEYDLTIKELDKLGKRILPLTIGSEIEWVTITRDLTKELTLENKKAMLQIMYKKLGQHADALAQAKILMVHTAQRPDKYPDPLDKFYDWLLRKHQLTVRQQLTKFRTLMQNMLWFWRNNPADRILEIMHEVQLTWDDAMQIKALREELKAMIGSKIGIKMYLTLCEKPINEWWGEITNFWTILRFTKETEEDDNKKQLNSTKGGHRKLNEDKNEVAQALVAEAKRSKIYKDNEKCPRCRKRKHPIQNCPLPRKIGRGNRERNKIKRQKLGDGFNRGSVPNST